MLRYVFTRIYTRSFENHFGRTRFVRYFESPASGQTVRRVFDFNALAFRQKRPVVDRIAVFERRRVVRGARQVQLHRLQIVQVVVHEIDPYTTAD